jgi:hypothetical protein
MRAHDFAVAWPALHRGPPQPYWAVPVRLSDEAKASRERREPCCGGLGERRPTRPGRRQKMTEHSPMPRD